MKIDRRYFLGLATFVPICAANGTALTDDRLKIQVTKGRGCGCCTAWTEILNQHGFVVTEDTVHPSELVQLKTKLGVPQDLMACHTARIGKFIVEGHVPPADIRRLISENPDGLGIAVAGMPYGSPGMGPEENREAYEVILFRKDRSRTVFNAYDSNGG